MLAALNGHVITTVKNLQAAGASITEKSEDGYSALHFAAINGNISIMLVHTTLPSRGWSEHQ
jgi:ankyrin repeat protein